MPSLLSLIRAWITYIFQLIHDLSQVQVTSTRWHLFEWCDLDITPSIIKTCCQNTLTAQWTKRLPLLQSHPPATLAASLIQSLLTTLPDSTTTPYTIIDFCSGAGGPTPFIERTLNTSRLALSQPAIPFRLSDIHPNLDAWITHSSHSEYLSFIPQPVNALHPPASVISTSIASSAHLPNAGTKTIHLFSLSFHHFDDDAARQVLAATTATSDAFAIIELQDRTLGSLLLLSMEWLLLLLVTWLWFPNDGFHLLATYAVPVLPVVQVWDGLVSCMRTRSVAEMQALLDGVLGDDGEWTIEFKRELHTRPFGYMNAVLGRRRSVRAKGRID